MSRLWILVVPLGLHFLFEYLSKTETKIGSRLRASDRAAAELEIELREREISEIRKWIDR